ncbi:hypothetical protein C8R46DRAFT_1035134 [Mycena filopes]|nr:hypothetical protein C8R46DRAFT_1035134 [Mycena filopes]
MSLGPLGGSSAENPWELQEDGTLGRGDLNDAPVVLRGPQYISIISPPPGFVARFAGPPLATAEERRLRAANSGRLQRAEELIRLAQEEDAQDAQLRRGLREMHRYADLLRNGSHADLRAYQRRQTLPSHFRRAPAPPPQVGLAPAPPSGTNSRQPRVGDLLDTYLYVRRSTLSSSVQCGHSYCYVCICTWLDRQWTCPVCVTVITTRPFCQYAEEDGLAYDYPTWVDKSRVSYSWEGLTFSNDGNA